MNDIRNCKKCNTIFSSNEGAKLCNDCQINEEKAFEPVRDYLFDNPGKSIRDLSVKFNISVKRIDEYIRNGRIHVI